MPETKHFTTKATVTADGDEQGLLEAVFSTFDTVDLQGDVVLKSTFTEGQEVPMVWSHDWDRPIGKGAVHVRSKDAVFRGQLWLDTDDGLQAFRKIRNSGSLQEFSWGFQITDAEPGTRDGQPVRFIKAAELYEVSPVLVGANRNTRILSLKAGEAPPGADPPPQVPAEPEQPETLQEKALAMLGAVVDFQALVSAADLADDETRKALQATITRLGRAQRELAEELKRTDPASKVEPRNQYRRFQELTAQHGLSTTPIGRA